MSYKKPVTKKIDELMNELYATINHKEDKLLPETYFRITINQRKKIVFVMIVYQQ
jgi:hypothetical protein